MAQALECAGREAEYAGHLSAAAFLDLLAGQWGGPLRLAAEVQGACGASSTRFATTVALAWGLTQRLQYIGLTLRRRPEGLSSLVALGSRPHEGAFTADPGGVLTEDAFQGAVTALYETAWHHYTQAFALWPQVRERALTSHMILARLGRTLLLELAASKDVLSEAHITLPPRRLWTTAWGCLLSMRPFGRPSRPR